MLELAYACRLRSNEFLTLRLHEIDLGAPAPTDFKAKAAWSVSSLSTMKRSGGYVRTWREPAPKRYVAWTRPSSLSIARTVEPAPGLEPGTY
jgi:hypothetical protein